MGEGVLDLISIVYFWAVDLGSDLAGTFMSWDLILGIAGVWVVCVE